MLILLFHCTKILLQYSLQIKSLWLGLGLYFPKQLSSRRSEPVCYAVLCEKPQTINAVWGKGPRKLSTGA